jgi:hypothetical protein
MFLAQRFVIANTKILVNILHNQSGTAHRGEPPAMGFCKGLMLFTVKRRSMLQNVMQGLRLGWVLPTANTVKYGYEFLT